MKVRCIKLSDSRGNPQERSSWLTVGKLYQVLAIELDNGGLWLLRLIGDGLNGVALFRLEDFEVISAKVSPSWVVCWKTDGLFDLSPERWARPGFWEKFYDNSPEAVRIFEEEKKRIVDADS
jgi:hypothetical protein